MYKNRRSRALAPLSSTQNKTLTNSNLLTSISSIHPVASFAENVDPGPSTAKRIKPSQQQNSSQNDNLFEIPSSQNPTQARFSSQRSIMARTQSILGNQRQPKNYFENVLIKCGVGLEAMECYVLTLNHLKFVNKVREEIRSHDTFPENITEFVRGVADAIQTYMNLKKMFSGCTLSLPSSDNIYHSQESLIKDLLMIDFLQVHLIEVLFKKIETFVGDDETLKLEVPYVDLILCELKFLNIVEHGDIVSLKFFEVFQLATTNYQQVIIRALPDIIDIGRHDEALEKLMRIIPDDTHLLTFSNVDTFGNMHLNARNQSELRKKIINHMRFKASLECFPSFVKFILRINIDESETLPQVSIIYRKNVFI
ncbi:Fanconi anemia group D2 protein like [Pseudolycoriella hygida]|uniref:Fanconi anemia group D2 protein like n=1 Tax=Pseudolycoriella hygida TaxID=35572 RepID=A0A9Q0RYK7_9DIPT|nr:Fanconi anemia group D2 protein like [Pseudolycoriella hygida]